MIGIDYDVIAKSILETGQSKRKRRRKERVREPGIQGVKKVMKNCAAKGIRNPCPSVPLLILPRCGTRTGTPLRCHSVPPAIALSSSLALAFP